MQPCSRRGVDGEGEDDVVVVVVVVDGGIDEAVELSDPNSSFARLVHRRRAPRFTPSSLAASFV